MISDYICHRMQLSSAMAPWPAEQQVDDDLFAEVHDLEAKQVALGNADGVRDGLVAGYLEGYEYGLQKGYEIGYEVGYIQGCVEALLRLKAQRRNPPYPGNHQTPQLQTTQGNCAAVSCEPSGAHTAQSQLAALSLGTSCSVDPLLQPNAPAKDGSLGSGQTHHDLQPAWLQASHTIHASGVRWVSDGDVHGLLLPERAEKALASLEQLLAEFDFSNPKDERLHDMVERLRGRFKALASMLGMLPDYLPREPPSVGQQQGRPPVATGAADLSF